MSHRISHPKAMSRDVLAKTGNTTATAWLSGRAHGASSLENSAENLRSRVEFGDAPVLYLLGFMVYNESYSLCVCVWGLKTKLPLGEKHLVSSGLPNPKIQSHMTSLSGQIITDLQHQAILG